MNWAQIVLGASSLLVALGIILKYGRVLVRTLARVDEAGPILLQIAEAFDPDRHKGRTLSDRFEELETIVARIDANTQEVKKVVNGNH